jgi:hypothetical protein
MLRAVLGVLLCGRAVADDRCIGGWQSGDGYGGAEAYETYVGTYTSRESCSDAVKRRYPGASAASYCLSAYSGSSRWWNPGDCVAEYFQTATSSTSNWDNCVFASGTMCQAGFCYPESKLPLSGWGGGIMWGYPSTPQECYDLCVDNDRPSVKLYHDSFGDFGCSCNCPGGQTSFKFVGLVSIEVRPMFDSHAGHDADRWDAGYEMTTCELPAASSIANMDWSLVAETYVCFTEHFDPETIMYECTESTCYRCVDDDSVDELVIWQYSLWVGCPFLGLVAVACYCFQRQQTKRDAQVAKRRDAQVAKRASSSEPPPQPAPTVIESFLTETMAVEPPPPPPAGVTYPPEEELEPEC